MTTHAESRWVGPRRPLQVLPPAEVDRIHEASLEVLAETGVVFYSQKALDVLEEHGATVDRETTVARIPAATVEEALRTLPRQFLLGGRTPEFDLPLDGEHAYITSDGCATSVREADGSVRPSVRQDVYDAARVVDALPNLSASSALVSAQDCPAETRVLHEFDACLRGSRKHTIAVSIKDAAEAGRLVRMAEAVTGGREELRRRPLFSAILCTVSPLHQERTGMELGFELAAAGIPLLLYPMPILGATAPVTPAGAAVVGNCEILAAVTAIQLACPGAPLIHAGGPTALSMRTGAYYANAPEALLLRAVQAQMAQRYGLPAGLGWGSTNAKEPGAQAAYDNATGLLLEFLAGADFLFGAGLLDRVLQLSLEQLVIADETFGIVTRLLKGVTVDRDTLAVDLIKKHGRRGDYLFDAHTRSHAHELWRTHLSGPPVAPHGAVKGSAPVAGAASGAEAHATAVAEEILATPAPAFPADLGNALDEIIAAAESGRL